MRYRLLPIGLLLAFLAAPALQIHVLAEQDEPAARTPDLDRVRQLIREGTNQFRKENGKGNLTDNTKLAAAAQDFAAFMARTDKYSHTADGKEPWQRMKAQDYDYCMAAENIAWQFNSEGFTTEQLAHAFLEGWKNSPPHRKNLLNEHLHEIGIGIAYSTKTGRYYAVQDFGRPKSAEISFQVENHSGEKIKYTVDDKEITVEPQTIMTHQACVPPELRFVQPGKEKKTYHPGQGARFVLSPQENGGYTIEEQAAAKSGSK